MHKHFGWWSLGIEPILVQIGAVVLLGWEGPGHCGENKSRLVPTSISTNFVSTAAKLSAWHQITGKSTKLQKVHVFYFQIPISPWL